MHKPIRRIATLLSHCLAVLAACVAAPLGAQTDLADSPMVVGNNAPPNYMFVLDNSSSMKNIVPESPYSATSGAYACPTERQVATTDVVYLTIVGNQPRVRLTVGNQSKLPSCTDASPCEVGSDLNKTNLVCFADTLTYENVRLLVDANGMVYASGRYSGHYLNWYFRGAAVPGYETAKWNDRKPGTRTRLDVAKAALKDAVAAIPASSTGGGVRAGLAIFNGIDGGRLVRAVEALNVTAFNASVDGISAAASVDAAPLSEALADVGQYFSLGYRGTLSLRSGTTVSVNEFFRQDNPGGTFTPHRLLDLGTATAPVQSGYWCQRSHAFLMTDGLSSEDQALSKNSYLCDYDADSGGASKCGSGFDMKLNTGTPHAGHLAPNGETHLYGTNGSDFLDDVAQALYETDLRPDIVHPRGEKKSNNVRTYTIAFGDAFTDQKKDPRKDSLLVEAARQGGGLSGKAGSQSELVRAFTSAVNTASQEDSAAAAVAVTSQRIAANTIGYESVYQSGYWTGDLIAHSLDLSTGLPIGDPLWSAQKKLDDLGSPATSRKVVSLGGSSGAAFTSGNFANAATGLTADVIDFLRGNRSKEGADFRSRQHLLGDIINAEPVYASFASGPVVFQAANDGMLHAFGGGDDLNNDGGDELWAYVPKMLHGELARLADPNYTHRYFIDATPALAQVSTTSFTGTLLVGGLGKGGRGYYGLNVTNPRPATEADAAKMVKWETVPSTTGSGFSFGTPLIVRTPNDGWVVLVTSGYNNGDGKGYVWALDPATGNVVKTMEIIDPETGSSPTPAGLTHLSRLSIAAAEDVAYYVYGGDLLGNVWRFDLSKWTAVKIAELKDGSGAPQPVTSAPAVGQVAGDANKFFVYVGTGQYLGETDVPGTGQNTHATQAQTMYGIIDDVSVPAPTMPVIRGSNGSACPSGGGDGAFICQGTASLQATTVTLTTNPLQAGVHRGWYWDIPMQYGRVNTNPALDASGVLVFTVNVPTREICGKGGSSWLMMIDAGTGGAIAKSSTSSEVYASGQFIGDVLSSRPVIVVTSKGKFVLTRTTGATTKSNLLPNRPGGGGGGSKGARVIYWRPLM